MGNLNKKTSHPKSLKFLEREYIRFNTLNRIYFVFKIPRNLLIVKGFFRKNCELGVEAKDIAWLAFGDQFLPGDSRIERMDFSRRVGLKPDLEVSTSKAGSVMLSQRGVLPAVLSGQRIDLLGRQTKQALSPASLAFCNAMRAL